MDIKLINQLEGKLKNKRVFLRLDLNVPLQKNKVLDFYKIEATVKTIDYLVEQGAIVIVSSHLGRPDGKVKAELSLKPVALALAKISAHKLKFIPEIEPSKIKPLLKNLKSGEIVCLENLRFHPGEEKNNATYAKGLASLADYYVNDALAVSHREHASVVAITKYLPSYGGFHLEEELLALAKVLTPRKPLVIIMGGAKIQSKLPLIDHLYARSSKILLGGGLANTFFKQQGLEIGKSITDSSSEKELARVLKKRKSIAKVVAPVDVVVKNRQGKILAKPSKSVLKTDNILDIGPDTISLYAKHIKSAQTLVWNGPMGKFEEKEFSIGTLALARLIAARSSGRAYGVAGGGETIAALKHSSMIEFMDWVSTAGGAMLTYLGGEPMPGLEVLKK